MKIILFLFIIGQYQKDTVAIETAEFESLAACQAAASKIEREVEPISYSKSVVGVCVNRG